jgi:hypothetical protein
MLTYIKYKSDFLNVKSLFVIILLVICYHVLSTYLTFVCVKLKFG